MPDASISTDVARVYRSYSRVGAGHDHVARQQLDATAEIGDELRDGEEEAGRAEVLFRLSVHARLELLVGGVEVRLDHGAQGAEAVEPLADQQGAHAHLRELYPAGAHVVPAAVAEDVVERVGLGDVARLLADDDHQLGLELDLLVLAVSDVGRARVDDRRTRADHGRGGLHEEHRKLGRLHAALDDVVLVVEPGAYDLIRLNGGQQRQVGQVSGLRPEIEVAEGRPDDVAHRIVGAQYAVPGVAVLVVPQYLHRSDVLSLQW